MEGEDSDMDREDPTDGPGRTRTSRAATRTRREPRQPALEKAWTRQRADVAYPRSRYGQRDSEGGVADSDDALAAGGGEGAAVAALEASVARSDARLLQVLCVLRGPGGED